eukprot:39623_1
MKSAYVTAKDYKMYIIIIISSFLLYWMLQEVMERVFGLNPLIKKSSEINATTNEPAEQMTKYVMNKRMSKTLDLYGNYRIVPRGSIQYVKGILCLFTFVWLTILFAKNNGKFFIDHFIHLSVQSANNKMYLVAVSLYIGWYMFEIISNRYGKLYWSVVSHHVMSIFALTVVLLGYYNPFAPWYGYSGVALFFVFPLAKGFRDTKSNKYPNCTRFMFKFLFYYFIMACLINFGGQIYLLVNGIITDKIDLFITIIMIIVELVWAYDDYCLIKALKTFSTMQYELVDELVGDAKNSNQNMKFKSPTQIEIEIQITNKNTCQNY